MKFGFLLIVFSLLFFSCSGEKVPSPDVYEIKDIGQLSTSEYTVGKIIKLDDSQFDWWDWSEWTEWTEWTDIDKTPKIGERKILINCRAKIKAGVDLSTIKNEDIQIHGNTIEITLPPAEITSFSMDPDQIQTEMESVTWLRDGFTQSDKNELLKQGEKAIKADIINTSILKDANDNAELFVKDFYKQLGYEKVIIKKAKKSHE